MLPSLCTFKRTTWKELPCRVPRDEYRVRLTTPPCTTLQKLQVLLNSCQHLNFKVNLLQLANRRLINAITTDWQVLIPALQRLAPAREHVLRYHTCIAWAAHVVFVWRRSLIRNLFHTRSVADCFVANVFRWVKSVETKKQKTPHSSWKQNHCSFRWLAFPSLRLLSSISSATLSVNRTYSKLYRRQYPLGILKQRVLEMEVMIHISGWLKHFLLT